MTSTENGVQDKVIDGLTEYVTAVNDRQVIQFGAMLYKRVASEVEPLIRADDVCRVAFPSMIIRPDLRVECLVVVLQDRLVIAWKAGLFRKAAGSIVIPFAGITGVRRERGATPSTRRAEVLAISGDQSATLALPLDKADAAVAVIRTAIGPVGD